MDKSDLAAFLKAQVVLFRDFSDARLKELLQASCVTTFEPNEAVIEFGEEGGFLGVLLDGEAEVSVTDDSGEKHSINLLKAGDIFGEMSLMTGDKTMADVIGVTRCKVLLIPESLFSSVLITYPSAIKYLSKMIAKRLKAFAYDD